MGNCFRYLFTKAVQRSRTEPDRPGSWTEIGGCRGPWTELVLPRSEPGLDRVNLDRDRIGMGLIRCPWTMFLGFFCWIF